MIPTNQGPVSLGMWTNERSALCYLVTSQVSSVGGDHDEGEEPPHARHHPRGDCPEREGESLEQFSIKILLLLGSDV